MPCTHLYECLIMIVLSQFDIAAGIMGRDQACDLFFGTLEDVDHILADLTVGRTNNDAVADRLHTHLNSLTALGACEIARLLGRVETDLREQRTVSASALFSLTTLIQTTRTFFVSNTGADRA